MLQERFILDMSDTSSVRKMTISDKTSGAEKAAGLAYRALQFPCRVRVIQEYGSVHPEYTVFWANVFKTADQRDARLLADEITIGEYNRAATGDVVEAQSEWLTIGQRIAMSLQQSHEYEVQRRQQAAQALQAWGFQQQQLANQQMMINAMNRPVTTNCQYIGVQLNCTSW